jgi:hypothetical protein
MAQAPEVCGPIDLSMVQFDTAAPGGQDRLVTQLSGLHDRGVLSDAERGAAKAKVLAG